MQAWSSRPVDRIESPAAAQRVHAFDSARQELVPVGPASGTAISVN